MPHGIFVMRERRLCMRAAATDAPDVYFGLRQTILTIAIRRVLHQRQAA
jgi:hypothetical protein